MADCTHNDHLTGLNQFLAREAAHTANKPCGDPYCPVRSCATGTSTEGATVTDPFPLDGSDDSGIKPRKPLLHHIIGKIRDEAFEALDYGADAYNESQCDPTDDGSAADWYAAKYNRLMALADALGTPGINEIGGVETAFGPEDESYCPVCIHDRYPRDFGLCFECGFDPYEPRHQPRLYEADADGRIEF